MGPCQKSSRNQINWLILSICLLLIHLEPVLMRAQTETDPNDPDPDDDDLDLDLDTDKLDGVGVLNKEDEEDLMTGMTSGGGTSNINNNNNNDPNFLEKGHKPGGLPMMSDSLFSLIILVYVSVAFCIVFFLFCWKASTDDTNNNGMPDYKQECPLMTNELREAIAASEAKKSESKVLMPKPLQMVPLNNCGIGGLPVVNEEKENSSAC